MIVWKKLVLVGLLSGSLIAVGCGDDGGTTPAVDSGAPDTTSGMDTGGGGTGTPFMSADMDFVASRLDIARVGGDGTVDGFNLDGIVSDNADPMGCFIEDGTSPSGVTGIDNQFAVLVPTLESLGELDITMTLVDAINDGSILVLMALTGADSTEDDSVVANLHLGEVTGGGAPMLAGDSIAPGQMFTITSTDTIMATGSITGGRFSASVDNIALNLPLAEGTEIALNIRNAELAADIIDGASPSLGDGLIGGSLNVMEIVDAIAAVPDFAEFESIARDTLENMADLEPNGDGDCQNISVGLEFDAVAAAF